jgi:hypothetical protein
VLTLFAFLVLVINTNQFGVGLALEVVLQASAQRINLFMDLEKPVVLMMATLSVLDLVVSTVTVQVASVLEKLLTETAL